MTNWTPLHLHTHYSLLDGLSKPSQVASRCSELGFESCALTDHGTISGAVAFTQACRSKNIKPILGCEFYLSPSDCTIKNEENRKLSHLCVLAKNKNGWNNLIQAVSKSNDEENFYYRPRLDLKTLGQFAGGDLVAFSGHLGSDLANAIFVDVKLAYSASTEEEAKRYVHPEWVDQVLLLANQYRDIFGKENFFIEIQAIDQENSPAASLVVQGLRYIAKKYNFQSVATADSHYPEKQDSGDQLLLLCSAMKTTLRGIKKKLEENKDVAFGGFMKSNNFHIPSPEEIQAVNQPHEIATTMQIADMCEDYDILGQPMLPEFSCPEDKSEEDHLRNLCREGWVSRLAPTGKVNTIETKTLYTERVKKELEVISQANLSGYFLIVRDIVNSVHNKGYIPGPGRGSAAGCLISYLVGITQVDPIEYGLIFERFYNAGRNTAGHVSLPDIDIDVPASKRDDTIDYIRNKYGSERVGQMVTFGRLQGRSALKEVLRMNEACGFDEMNAITKSLPHEHEVSDQLAEMDNPSVIRWTLMNQPDTLREYCRLNDDGQLEGDYAKLFEQAMRIEGTFKSQGKHAAGVVISSHKLDKVCPMVRDKKGSEKIAGMEMNDLESMGHVKFDILGISLLDKIMGVRDQLESENV
jgi:DNA polymerase-3 subunit alpha